MMPIRFLRNPKLFNTLTSTNVSFKTRYMSGSSSMDRESTVIIGAVSYCDSVSSIWEGMRQYFDRSGVKLDFILFTSYERQLEYLLAGHIDIAWNGPVAHARLQRLVKDPISLGMRDVDRDFVSYILSTKDSEVRNVKDIENRRLATGTYDSPQAYILPMHYLTAQNVDLSTLDVIRFDKDIGKHGDTAIGEVDVIESLRNGSCDAGFVSKLMLDRRDKSCPGEYRLDLTNIISVPLFDHCQFDSLPSLSIEKMNAFQGALFKMDWNKEIDRVVMQSEGIREKWEKPRMCGYETVSAAISQESICVSPAPPHSANCHPFKTLSIISR